MSITTIRDRAASDRRRKERRALSLVLAVFALFLIGGAGGIWLLSAPAPGPACALGTAPRRPPPGA